MERRQASAEPLLLGAHTSIAGGLHLALERGQRVGADVIQIFAKNQMQWSARPYRPEEVSRFREAVQETGVKPITVHAAYLINPASPRPEIWELSLQALVDELQRAHLLGIPYLVVHPGSHLGDGEETGLKRVARTLEAAYRRAEVEGVTVLLETTAGQGHTLGYRPDHLARILEQVPELPLGVCLDTCHVFAAGFDLRSPEGWEALIAAFQISTGLSAVRVLHVNDSRHPVGSRKDRHARIGQGYMGLQGFHLLLHQEPLCRLPMVLEIPGGLEAYAGDLVLLRKLAEMSADDLAHWQRQFNSQLEPPERGPGIR